MWMPVEEVAAEIMRSLSNLMVAEHATPETVSRYLPFAASNAYTLATWRLGKGVYRFDDDLRQALLETPVTGDIPTDVLKRLPEWCVYVETPGFRPNDLLVHGFFACITRFNGEEVLHLTIDSQDPTRSRLIGFVPIGLSHRTIEDALRWNVLQSIAVTKDFSQKGVPFAKPLQAELDRADRDPERVDELVAGALGDVGPLLSLALYLCADDAEIDADRPRRPIPTVTKGGTRFFAAGMSRLIGVGLRLGARLRDARQRAANDRPAGTNTVIPHLRKAHWHTYLYGPRSGEQQRRLRWIHPTLVNDHARADDAPAVLHPVIADVPGTDPRP
jgi:hypothetical protein